MKKILSFQQHKSRFCIFTFITLAAIWPLLFRGKIRSESKNINEGGITKIIKDNRIDLMINGCRKILSENRLRNSYIVPENFVTIKR